MPHSSGGGSHGGGTHGGSHGGSSGPRVSTHYFAGSRRYRKHHISTGRDEYVYATSKPQKTGLSSIIFIAVFGIAFMGIGFFGILSDRPNKLKTQSWETAAVYDDIGIIDDKDDLIESMMDFQDITGICPVVYTTYDDIWIGQYDDLEDYAYSVYVNNYSDEFHFVIVYSIPESDVPLLKYADIGVADFSWEAIQGDDTDKILTETTFMHFAEKVHLELNRGKNPGKAFAYGFEYLNDKLDDQLKPGSRVRIMSIVLSCVPLLLVAGVFGLFIILSVERYKKEKDIEYEEVPMDVDVKDPNQVLNSAVTGNYRSKEFHYDLSKGGPVPKAAKTLTIAVTVPFIVVGLILTAAGFGTASSADRFTGIFMIIFGLFWTFFSVFTLIKMVTSFAKADKEADAAPLTAEYPKAEYPDVKQVNTTPPAPSVNQTEFDPQFFNNAKSNIEDDEEEYKRMKRKGYE